jgi:DNA-3-methyladenine glycosylase II
VVGDGDVDRAAAQARRFLSLDIDARGWPDIARRDPVMADAQQRLPGLRPCGFHSPYEAAAWAVLSQRMRVVQAAGLRDDLVRRHGQDGAFPAPALLRTIDLDLPGRKSEYLRAVADAALDGRLDRATLRSVGPHHAVRIVQEVKGLGPVAAELVVIRGANAPDMAPHHERRLDDEVTVRYGPDRSVAEVSDV